jgi:hypothetical protein
MRPELGISGNPFRNGEVTFISASTLKRLNLEGRTLGVGNSAALGTGTLTITNDFSSMRHMRQRHAWEPNFKM